MTLALEHITKRVGRETHIDDISLQLERGELNMLLGLTLAGKTTLMRLMAGLERPGQGRVLVDGRDVGRIPVRKRNVAMVHQQFINYPSMTAFQNIASPLRIARVARAEIDRRVRSEAERLHIEHLLQRLPEELSGGQQQRVAMARALVRDADLVLLDEPLVNLDYKLREELREELRGLFQDRDAVLVYATTDPWEALAMGGRTAVLQEGRLIQFGPTLEVHEEPATEHVAEVFSDPPMNRCTGTLADGEIRLGEGVQMACPDHLKNLTPGTYHFGLRPQHLRIEAREEPSGVAFPGEVTVAEISGSETLIHIEHEDNPWVLVAPGVHTLEPGQRVSVGLDPARLYAFDTAGRLHQAPVAFREQG